MTTGCETVNGVPSAGGPPPGGTPPGSTPPSTSGARCRRSGAGRRSRGLAARLPAPAAGGGPPCPLQAASGSRRRSLAQERTPTAPAVGRDAHRRHDHGRGHGLAREALARASVRRRRSRTGASAPRLAPHAPDAQVDGDLAARERRAGDIHGREVLDVEGEAVGVPEANVPPAANRRAVSRLPRALSAPRDPALGDDRRVDPDAPDGEFLAGRLALRSDEGDARPRTMTRFRRGWSMICIAVRPSVVIDCPGPSEPVAALDSSGTSCPRPPAPPWGRLTRSTAKYLTSTTVLSRRASRRPPAHAVTVGVAACQVSTSLSFAPFQRPPSGVDVGVHAPCRTDRPDVGRDADLDRSVRAAAEVAAGTVPTSRRWMATHSVGRRDGTESHRSNGSPPTPFVSARRRRRRTMACAGMSAELGWGALAASSLVIGALLGSPAVAGRADRARARVRRRRTDQRGQLRPRRGRREGGRGRRSRSASRRRADLLLEPGRERTRRRRRAGHRARARRVPGRHPGAGGARHRPRLRRGVSVGLLAAIFVSNLPEAIGSATDMQGLQAQASSRLWVAVAVVCTLATVAGYAIADSVSGEFQAGIDGFAAGALLVMLIDSMFPDARGRAAPRRASSPCSASRSRRAPTSHRVRPCSVPLSSP